jgi:GcrA cell cycle regulator
MTKPGVPWTDDDIAKLCCLWADGMLTEAIGRTLGRRKGSVVGKANRLGLPPRRSAVKRKLRVRHPTAVIAPVAQPLRGTGWKPTGTAPGLRAEAVPVCCWPLGDVKSRIFAFCTEKAAPGRPYCPAHVAIAYVRVSNRLS